MEQLRAILRARLALRINRLDPKEDRLVGVEEAAATLGTTRDWLRRHGARMPFTVRLSEGQVRYSAKGIDRWIASRVRYGGR